MKRRLRGDRSATPVAPSLWVRLQRRYASPYSPSIHAPISRVGLIKPDIEVFDACSAIVIKDVPAQVCNNCGDHYLPDELSREVLVMAEAAVITGAEVEILRWAA